MASSFDSSFDLSGPQSPASTSLTSESSGQYRIKRRARSPRATPVAIAQDTSAVSELSIYSTPPTDDMATLRSKRQETPVGDSPEASFSTPPDIDSGRKPRASFATPSTIMPGEKNQAISRINRGILRPSGTPGSGNGVRFFPKNKYRIITPNSSLTAINVDDMAQVSDPTPRPPSSPAPPSFMDRLRATASQSFSFTAPAPDSPGAFFTNFKANQPEDSSQEEEISEVKDDSWEAPGEEGEVSMASASEVSEFSSPMDKLLSEHHMGSPPFGGEPSFDHWMASIKVPSPAKAPAAMSTTPPDDQPLEEMSSRSMIVPEDMSNLMSADGYGTGSQFGSPSVSPTTETSFSVQSALPPLAGDSPAQEVAASFFEMSAESSDQSIGKPSWSQDDADTIHANIPQTAFEVTSTSPPVSPTPPSPPKEAELSVIEWQSAPDSSSSEDTSRHFFTPRKTSPLQQDATLYFDAPSLTPSLTHSGFSPAVSELRTASATPSPVALPAFLRGPTQDLFAAHSSHTAALLKSLQYHQDLVRDLQSEVAERDNVLQQLREEHEQEKGECEDREQHWHSEMERLRQMATTTQPSDVSSRDLQIRLEKERHDVQDVRRDLDLAQEEITRLTADSQALVGRAERAEAASREAQIVSAHRISPELDNAQARVEALENELMSDQRTSAGLVEARARVIALEQENAGLLDGTRWAESRAVKASEQVQQLKEELKEAEEQLARVQDNAEEQHDRAEDDAEARLAEQAEAYETRLREIGQAAPSQELEARIHELEEDNAEWQRVIADIEADLESLRREHDVTKADHAKTLDDLRAVDRDHERLRRSSQDQADTIDRLEKEIARLRSDSSSKDLEIMNLHKRKAELKDDREMLNIALDSKQQELELIKRKFAVRGVAGSTPLPASAIKKLSAETPASSMATPMPETMRSRRRSSMALVTPGMDRRGLRSVSVSSAAPLRVLGESRRQAAVVVEEPRTALKPARMQRSREAMLA